MKLKKLFISIMTPMNTANFTQEAVVVNKNIYYKKLKTKNYIKKNYSNIGLEENLILVNKDNSLDREYIPSNLKVPNISFVKDSTDDERYMESMAADAIEELFLVARNEGIEFLATSAYRSYEEQLAIYTRRVEAKGKEEADKYVAHPGKSEHQTGLSIDVTNRKRRFVKTCKEAIWLANNAHRFGFILRYPEGKEYITGISYEPWHVRYVGKEVARNIFNKGITLEEYIKNKIMIEA
ncbi:D-alanyl-D-alanine carboxypeptidase family protein [Romboutsia weinsteinii]|uniref:D-alanyl-D-alanine carboxypeptidase family protein n=1 Tax=Romboutsia weinsteinii TaxID=2020949 RepID=A0A371J4K9_9FIRM|nr:M15 family metallopeptidase [Romboutsia weinsteinii]RDY27720.1 D-alanyl-D-alanine carboxypeptidase family protein [Romboutsia weinsteinii]